MTRTLTRPAKGVIPNAEKTPPDRRGPLLRAPIPAAARVRAFGQLLTAEQFLRLPRTANKQELVDGRVVEMPPVGSGHGETQVTFPGRLSAWNKQCKLGRVFVETGYVFARGPDLVRGPDVSFIRAGKIPPDHDEDDYIEAVPDFVLEIRSKNDTMPELRAKAEEYLSFGVPLVWLLDRGRRAVEVYRPGRPPESLAEADVLDGGDVLPGFACAAADLID